VAENKRHKVRLAKVWPSWLKGSTNLPEARAWGFRERKEGRGQGGAVRREKKSIRGYKGTPPAVWYKTNKVSLVYQFVTGGGSFHCSKNRKAGRNITNRCHKRSMQTEQEQSRKKQTHSNDTRGNSGKIGFDLCQGLVDIVRKFLLGGERPITMRTSI